MPTDSGEPLRRVEAGGCVLEVRGDGTFSYLTADGQTGWRALAFAAMVGNHHWAARPAGTASGAEDDMALRYEYPEVGLSEEVTMRLLDNPAALTVERVVRNHTSRPVAVEEVLTLRRSEDAAVLLAGTPAAQVHYVHVSNLRETARRASHAVGPLVSPLPDRPRSVGDSEGYPFPAIAFGRGMRDFLLEGSLQQDVFTQTWWIEGNFDPRLGESIFARYAAVARDGRHQAVTIAPGEERRLSDLFYQIKTDCDLQDLYDDYLDELNRRYDLRGRRSVLLSEALYCTWNYTFYHDISERIIRDQCQFIAENLPGVRHFLIDDGYQLPDNKPSYDMGRFYPDPNRNVDPVKFPNGMQAVAEMIRSHGLRPAIWWSPALGRDNDLVREHPDWLCPDENGDCWTMDPGPYGKAALDFSVKGAREFVEHVLETIIRQWGYDGLKLDFCTYPFDSKDLRLRGGEAARWWYWLLETIARLLPDDGVFQVCGGAPHGNPLLGRYCDNHRVGGDIGKGEWARHRSVSAAPLPLLSVPGRSTLLMDVDSAGIRADMSDEENLSRLNFCHITQGVMGIGGDLTKLTDTQVGWLKRITDAPDRGYKVRCPDRRAFTCEPLPEALYVDYPPGSPTAAAGVRKEVALFNWDDEPTTIGYSLAALGIADGDAISDFWTGEGVRPEAGQLIAMLRPRESRLLQVRAPGEPARTARQTEGT